MEAKHETFEAWGMLDLFGHTKLAGRITEQTIGGVHFLRIDIPEVGDVPEHTRFFTQGAIYGMSLTSEEVARGLAARLVARPVQAYELPRINSADPPSVMSVDDWQRADDFLNDDEDGDH